MAYYYRVLGVDRAAGQNEIKKAYHRLARKFHPDHNGGHPLAELRFRMIAEAYTVLGDEEQRRAYDRFGPTALVRGGARQGVAGGVERLVNQLGTYVESRLRRAPRRGRDRRTAIEVTLAQAALGVQTTVDVPHRSRCRECLGTRAAPGTNPEACHVCGASGETRADSILGSTDTCPFCQGAGLIAVTPCPTCDGRGEVDGSIPVPIEVPAGVEPGRRLVLRGYGEPGENGGETGDLFVEVRVQQHPLLVRDGYDLRCSVPVTLREAVLGSEVSVPTFEGGSVRVKVPPGARSGLLLRLRGRGLPRPGRTPGDLLVEIELETPAIASAEARAALDHLETTARWPRRADYDRALERK